MSNVVKWGCLVFAVVSLAYSCVLAYTGSWLLAVLWLVVSLASLNNYFAQRDLTQAEKQFKEELEKLKEWQ